mmetsp:Transcript_88320/g.152928  ORF Transcript_88320/g.152928 Transcript_88320/m.152928 type:complete len:141 (-) Transcript_88320:195-617(-)
MRRQHASIFFVCLVGFPVASSSKPVADCSKESSCRSLLQQTTLSTLTGDIPSESESEIAEKPHGMAPLTASWAALVEAIQSLSLQTSKGDPKAGLFSTSLMALTSIVQSIGEGERLRITAEASQQHLNQFFVAGALTGVY